MKKLFSHVSMLFLAIALVACGGQQTEEKDKEKEVNKAKEEKEAKVRESRGFHLFDKEFQALAGNYDGVIRGVDLYATPEEVKAIEEQQKQIEFDGQKEDMPKAVLAEETEELLKYNLQMANTEDAVIEYQFQDGKLNGVKITVHVLSNVEFEAMEEDFINFFTHKFDLPDKIEGRKEVWKVKGSDVHEVDIIDKQDGDKFYLEIDIS